MPRKRPPKPAITPAPAPQAPAGGSVMYSYRHDRPSGLEVSVYLASGKRQVYIVQRPDGAEVTFGDCAPVKLSYTVEARGDNSIADYTVEARGDDSAADAALPAYP